MRSRNFSVLTASGASRLPPDRAPDDRRAAVAAREAINAAGEAPTGARPSSAAPFPGSSLQEARGQAPPQAAKAAGARREAKQTTPFPDAPTLARRVARAAGNGPLYCLALVVSLLAGLGAVTIGWIVQTAPAGLTDGVAASGGLALAFLALFVFGLGFVAGHWRRRVARRSHDFLSDRNEWGW